MNSSMIISLVRDLLFKIMYVYCVFSMVDSDRVIVFKVEYIFGS